MLKCGDCDNFQTVSDFERTGICQYRGFRTMDHQACQEHFEGLFIVDTTEYDDDLWEDGYYGC
jgi:hypothetical protein